LIDEKHIIVLTIAKSSNLQASLDTLQTNIDLKQDTNSNFEN
jgi:hypothetical protein